MSKTREMIDELQEQHEVRVKILTENALLIDSFAAEVEGIEFTTFKLGDSGGDFDLSFSGKKKDFELVWKALRRRGFEPDARPREKESAFATWFRKSGHSLSFWLYFSSKECKTVRVGTKMVEQAVYEVQCESELAELDI